MIDGEKNSIVIKRSPFKFFLIIYGLSIPLWILESLIEVNGLPLDIPITDIAAAFTPLIAACILIYKEEGRTGIYNLFNRIVDCKRITKKILYVPVIFLPIFIYFLIYLIIYYAGLPVPKTFQFSFLTIPVLLLFFLLGATLEETGYMGYAIDPIQARVGALSAGILIGIPWAVWHYSSIIQQGHHSIWIAWATLGTVAVRILIVWIYNNTGK